MVKKYIAAIDQGTTSSRTILFDENLDIVASHAIPITQIYPKQGWVEHDPMEILRTQIQSFEEVLKKSGVKAEEIHTVGVTNQRETVVLWDKNTGKPIHNAIVWR